MEILCDCCVFRGVPSLFTYAIADDLKDSIQEGSHVKVPIGHAKTDAVVMNVYTASDSSKKKGL